jgi:sucrose-phosphate synthase
MIIHLYNLHGLIKGNELEIGRDSDNGGQIVYLWELAQALSKRDDVDHIHIFTRKIDDPTLSKDYSLATEEVNDKITIQRVQCGGKKYLAKEQLWGTLDEFVANAIQHIKKNKIHPDWMHSHYADAAYVVNELSNILNVPYCHTAHSLGRTKKQRLLENGLSEQEAEVKFSFNARFKAEETVLANAEFVVTSTQIEIGEFGEYENGKYSDYHVIPPGTNVDRFYPYYKYEVETDQRTQGELQAIHSVRANIDKFFSQPDKPFILAICRPDRKKNIEGLIHAYGTDKSLQAMANLAIFAGIREDINEMPTGEKDVLTDILLLMDKYNLYGKLAIPKKHDANIDVPEAYRYCAKKGGVFVNPALTEHFGLTILEASSCGLPVIATQNGGPSETIPRCENGLLCDPYQTESLQKAMITLLTDDEKWKKASYTGAQKVRELYSWDAHAENYMKVIENNLEAHGKSGSKAVNKNSVLFERLRDAKKMLITDIDGTLVHDNGPNDHLEELKEILKNRGKDFVFGVATGRNLKLVQEILREHDICMPDVVISSVGSCIYYQSEEANPDKGWRTHINHRWNRGQIEKILRGIPQILLQEPSNQNSYKISFYINEEDLSEEDIIEALGKYAHQVNIIYSKGKFLDVLPKRASKGKAIRYLAHKWAISQKETIVCGDTGNDFDMFTTGANMGIIVNNYSKELESLKGKKNVYFSSKEAGGGILDGMNHYKWIK